MVVGGGEGGWFHNQCTCFSFAVSSLPKIVSGFDQMLTPSPPPPPPPPTPTPRLVSNHVMRVKTAITKPVEWAYCFDVHLNAFVPLAILVYGIQMLLWPRKDTPTH